MNINPYSWGDEIVVSPWEFSNWIETGLTSYFLEKAPGRLFKISAERMGANWKGALTENFLSFPDSAVVKSYIFRLSENRNSIPTI